MNIATEHWSVILQSYRTQIERKIQEAISYFGPSSILREACAYALTNGGKRFRPALVLMLGKALDPKRDLTEAALAIECFHTASLIADDLPCMDDDDERRDKPSLHKVYGEATALLTSYALISEGYSCLCRNTQILKAQGIPHAEESGLLAIENASKNTGLCGAAGGQHLDLYPSDNNLETLLKMHNMKTGAVFEIAFVFGWLFGGGNPAQLNEVKKASANFGMAFQIADDLMDLDQDRQEGRGNNIALLISVPEAKNLFENEIQALLKRLQNLQIHSPDLLGLIELMKERVI